jgi:predicted cupin superfamily sugar epimerase
MDVQQIIKTLNMKPHPEGGFYAETFRHIEMIVLPDGRKRNLSTTIYFLLTDRDKSHFHRLGSDETWFFHCGETIELITLEKDGTKSYVLGGEVTAGQLPQLRIPANTWFAAHLPAQKGYALVSCTVCPGFDFEDFELARGEQLTKEGWKIDEKLRKFIIENKIAQ